MSFLQLAGVLALICLVRSENTETGQCKEVSTNFDLNMPRLEGTWYLIASTNFTGAPVGTTCAVCNKTFVDNTIVVNARSYQSPGGPETELFHGVITQQGVGQEKMSFNYPNGLSWSYFRYLDSNYATYDLVYACQYFNGIYQGTVVAVYSRFCNFRNDVLREATEKLAELKIDAELVHHFGGPECCNEESISTSSSDIENIFSNELSLSGASSEF